MEAEHRMDEGAERGEVVGKCLAWEMSAALVGGALFVSVFGFSQFVLAGNFNYATPYAHGMTHGVLACLPLGVTAVLKPEIIYRAVGAQIYVPRFMR